MALKFKKITNRNNNVLVTATNIAGVELDDNTLPSDEEEDEAYVENF
jgi:hypothetical protein